MPKYCTFLATALLGLTASAPAFANPSEVPVSYKDLNLTSVEDRAELDGRLRGAAADVCSAHGKSDIGSVILEQKCKKVALSEAREKAQIAVARAKSDQEVASAK